MRYSFLLLFCLPLITPCAGFAYAFSTSDQPGSGLQTILLNDTLLFNTLPVPPGTPPTLLNEKSRIKSAQVIDSHLRFNLGLVDMEGDGIFNNPEKDLLVLTFSTNRQVRVNGNEGTPHTKVREGLLLQVDQHFYRLRNIADNGKSLQLESAPAGKPDLSLFTHVGELEFIRYTGGKLNMDSIIAQKPFTFIYFWTTNGIVEYQLNKMAAIEAQFPEKVTLIGVHCRDCELDKSTESDFFKWMSIPRHGSYCRLAQFESLYQDRSWGRGLLICDNRKIIFPNISAKELLQWLEAGADAGICE